MGTPISIGTWMMDSKYILLVLLVCSRLMLVITSINSSYLCTIKKNPIPFIFNCQPFAVYCNIYLYTE